jgi:hypothetical protein
MNRPAGQRRTERCNGAMLVRGRRTLRLGRLGRRLGLGGVRYWGNCRRRLDDGGRRGRLVLFFDSIRVCLRFQAVQLGLRDCRFYVVRNIVTVVAAQLDRHVFVD